MSGVLHGVVASLKSAAAAVTDAFFNYVSLLLPGTGTNGAQNNTFIDGSANAFSIVRNGNTTQGTFGPFSQKNWSNYFDGSGDYLEVTSTSSTLRDWWTTDWTIEAWVLPVTLTTWAIGSIPSTVGNSTALGSTSYWAFGPLTNGTVTFYYFNGAGVNVTSTQTVNARQWNHIAMIRDSSGIKIFVNGVGNAYTAISGTPQSASTPITIGQFNSTCVDGFISNCRIVFGTALYTSNFTPPTSPLTAVTNTSLLTCQSNRFIDNSTNAFAITRTGNVRVAPYSPFAPATSYVANVNGASGYFDGTGDTLEVSGSSGAAAFTFGTDDVTIEFWVNLSTISGTQGFYYTQGAGTNAVYAIRQINGGIEWIVTDAGGGGIFTATSAANALIANIWNHVAVVRSGNVHTIYVNGTASGTPVTISYSAPAPQANIFVGSRNNTGLYFTGFMSDLRVVKGTAVYTANFTPPTAPLTAVTNTSLLLNFANAGIVDAATFNNMETIGDAQISSAQAKWGSTSIAFDGTGDSLPVIGASPFGLYNQLVNANRVNTIEMWLYVTAFTSPRAFLVGSWVATPSNAGWTYDVDTSGNIFLARDSGGGTITLTNKITSGAWQHIAIVNDGTNIKIYRNGTLEGQSVCQTASSTITPLYVGRRSDGTLALNGFIQDLRITNGVARYTANFTAPTAAFPTL